MSKTLIETRVDVQTVEVAVPERVIEQAIEQATLTEHAIEQVIVTERVIDVIEHDSRDVTIITAGEQGPRGIQGQPGTAGSAHLTYLAAGPLSGHRAVRAAAGGTVTYADQTELAYANAVLGITMHAAEDGAQVSVQFSGEMVEPSWDWEINQPVFLGANGHLTQAVPATGVCLILGVATAPTVIAVAIKQPIIFVEG